MGKRKEKKEAQYKEGFHYFSDLGRAISKGDKNR